MVVTDAHCRAAFAQPSVKDFRPFLFLLAVSSFACGCGGQPKELDVEIVFSGPRDLIEHTTFSSLQLGMAGPPLFESGRFRRTVSAKVAASQSWRFPIDVKALFASGRESTTRAELWICSDSDNRKFLEQGWSAKELHEIRVRPDESLQPESEFGFPLSHTCEFTRDGEGMGSSSGFRKPQFCTAPDRDVSTLRIESAGATATASWQLCQASYSSYRNGRIDLYFSGTFNGTPYSIELSHCVAQSELYPLSLGVNDFRTECQFDYARINLGNIDFPTILNTSSGSWVVQEFEKRTGGTITSSFDLVFGEEGGGALRLIGKARLPYSKFSSVETMLPLD